MARIDIQSVSLTQAYISGAEVIGMDMLLVIAARSLYGRLQKQKHIFENEHMQHAHFVAKTHVFWQDI